MLGSLDHPPIVIHSSRMTSALLLLACAAFVAICAWILSYPGIARGARNAALAEPAAYLGIVFFGLGIPYSGWRLVRPDKLILAPEGIDWHAFGRTMHIGWDTVHSFRAWALSGNYNLVGFSLTTPLPARHGCSGLTQRRQASTVLSAVDGSSARKTLLIS